MWVRWAHGHLSSSSSPAGRDRRARRLLPDPPDHPSGPGATRGARDAVREPRDAGRHAEARDERRARGRGEIRSEREPRGRPLGAVPRRPGLCPGLLVWLPDLGGTRVLRASFRAMSVRRRGALRLPGAAPSGRPRGWSRRGVPPRARRLSPPRTCGDRGAPGTPSGQLPGALGGDRKGPREEEEFRGRRGVLLPGPVPSLRRSPAGARGAATEGPAAWGRGLDLSEDPGSFTGPGWSHEREGMWVVGRPGLEPGTDGLKVRSSTD